jgi:tetratricopeptide (TPR) repeat protein
VRDLTGERRDVLALGLPIAGRCGARLAWIALLALAAGCAGLGRAPLATQAVELTDTPFHPREDYLCGPAALATVLGHSGVDVEPDALAPALYIPGRQGTLQVELMAGARRHGRLAVTLDPTLEALVAQLEHGRPVLVLQNLGLQARPVWHYAVVVGYQPDADRFVLRSGVEQRQVVSRARFAATWRRADQWGLTVADPAAEPSGLPPGAYLKAAADLEDAAAHELALQAFRSAARAWPDQPAALLGIANNLYYLRRYAEAAEAYRQLIARHPDQAVAVHNLSVLLLQQGDACEAAAVLAAADAGGDLVERARRAVEPVARAQCPGT